MGVLNRDLVRHLGRVRVDRVDRRVVRDLRRRRGPDAAQHPVPGRGSGPHPAHVRRTAAARKDADDIFLYIAEEDVGLWVYSAEPDGGEQRTLVTRDAQHEYVFVEQ